MRTRTVIAIACVLCLALCLGGCKLNNETALPSEEDFLPTIQPEYYTGEADAVQPVGEDNQPLDSITFYIVDEEETPLEGLSLEISQRGSLVGEKWVYPESATIIGTSNQAGQVRWEAPLSGRYTFYVSSEKKSQAYEIEIFEREQMQSIRFTFQPA